MNVPLPAGKANKEAPGRQYPALPSRKEPETGVIRLLSVTREGAGLNPVSPVNTGL